MKTKNRALFAAITVFTCIFMILSNAVAIIKDVAISKTFSETDFTHALLALVYLALAIAIGTNSRKAFPVVCLAIPIVLNIYSFSKLYSQTSMSLSFTTIYSFLVSISAYLVPMLILIFENCQKSGKAKRYFRFIVWLPVISTIIDTIKVKDAINDCLKEAIKWANNPDYILYVVNHALLFISAVLFPIFVYFLCAWALSGTSMFAAFDFRKEAAPETEGEKGCRSIRVNHAWGAEIVTAIIALIAILLYLFPGSAPLYSLFKLGLLLWTLAGIVSGLIILVPNMLIIQLLNNIQTMREKSDKE